MRDPRLTPARPDLAAACLRGQVEAARFVEGEISTIIAPIAPLRRAPRFDAMLDTEALMGERAIVYERNDEGWAWVQLERDSYVGYLPADMIAQGARNVTHRVRALRTFAFPGPSIKLPPFANLPMDARLEIVNTTDDFAITAQGWHIPICHVVPVNDMESDFVEVALRFLGTPYLWGGRTSLGIDCSGLVQSALAACGLSAPRDSDMQEQTLGVALARDEWSKLQRGDIVFWKGHVAIAVSGDMLLHANAFHMAVALEPFAHAIARIKEAGSNITSIRRPESKSV